LGRQALGLFYHDRLVGVSGGAGLHAVVKSQLYQVTKVDAGVLLGARMVLGIAVGVAGLIPAKRDASIEPMEALRTE
jgi:ABC-type antimicrobial peptide transport system permease subunit